MMPDVLVHITFSILPHNRLERTGANLAMRQNINVFDYILGTKIVIDDIYGRTLEVTIPPRTNPGQEFRIPGRGLPSQFGNGDLYVLTTAVLPDKISESLIGAIRSEHQTSKEDN